MESQTPNAQPSRHSQTNPNPVIPRYYWESKAKTDPHFREDDGTCKGDNVGLTPLAFIDEVRQPTRTAISA